MNSSGQSESSLAVSNNNVGPGHEQLCSLQNLSTYAVQVKSAISKLYCLAIICPKSRSHTSVICNLFHVNLFCTITCQQYACCVTHIDNINNIQNHHSNYIFKFVELTLHYTYTHILTNRNDS